MARKRKWKFVFFLQKRRKIKRKLWSLRSSNNEKQFPNCEALVNRWFPYFQCSEPAVITDLRYGLGQFLKPPDGILLARTSPTLINWRRGLVIHGYSSFSLSSLQQIPVIVIWESARPCRNCRGSHLESYCCEWSPQTIFVQLWMRASDDGDVQN